MPVDKKVRFFAPMDAHGQPWPGDFPAAAILDRFDELEAAGPTEGVLQLAAQRDLSGRHLTNAHNLRHGVLYMFKRDDWPMVHDFATGKISPLDLPNTAELAEPTYFAFCPRNVLAVLYNHIGPKVGHLSRYLAEFYEDIDVNFEPIVSLDVMKTIADAGEIRSIAITIPTAQLDVFPQNDALMREVRTLANRSHAEKMELRWSIDARSRNWADRESFTGWGKGVVNRIGQRLEAFNKAVVTVAPDDAEDDPALDLLHESIVMTEEVQVVPGTKWIEPDAAAQAIWTAYRRARPQLQAVMGE
jgi:hypothetical protein